MSESMRARLAARMTAAGMTQADLARGVGMTPAAISRYLAGRHDVAAERYGAMIRAVERWERDHPAPAPATA